MKYVTMLYLLVSYVARPYDGYDRTMKNGSMLPFHNAAGTGEERSLGILKSGTVKNDEERFRN